jgi:pimeloyl-ACP methyl ester carboxylesterase
LGVFAVEYPGYGLSRGVAPSEKGIYAAAEAALQHLSLKMGIAPEQVVIEGQSLGSGVAMEMIHRGHGARLVLLTPFTSMEEMARRMAPILPARLLLRHHFENAAKAREVKVPALVLHGTADLVVPFKMGQQMAAILPNAEFRQLDGGGHDLQSRFAPGMAKCIAAFARGQACTLDRNGKVAE